MTFVILMAVTLDCSTCALEEFEVIMELFLNWQNIISGE